MQVAVAKYCATLKFIIEPAYLLAIFAAMQVAVARYRATLEIIGPVQYTTGVCCYLGDYWVCLKYCFPRGYTDFRV